MGRVTAGKREVREGGPSGGPARTSRCPSPDWVRAWQAWGRGTEGRKRVCLWKELGSHLHADSSGVGKRMKIFHFERLVSRGAAPCPKHTLSMASCKRQRTLALSSHVGPVLDLREQEEGTAPGGSQRAAHQGLVGQENQVPASWGRRGGGVGALEPERPPAGRLCCCRRSQVLQTLKGAGWARTPLPPANIQAGKDRTPACPAGALAWPTLERQLEEPLPAPLR